MAVLLLLLAFIGGCGGSGHHVTNPQTVPVVVSISDQPPAGINVVSFDVTVSGACLLQANQTSCTTGENLLTSPETIQFANLETPTQSDLLSNLVNVDAGTYTSVLLTFSSATATVSVDPQTSFTDGTTTCTNPNLAGGAPIFCQLSPAFSPSSVTIPFTNGASITLTAGTVPVQIAIDLNVGNSLVASTANPPVLSINPVATVTENTTVGTDGNLIDVTQVTGTVSSVSSSSITLTDSTTGQPVTLAVGTSTVVSNYPMNTTTCTAPNVIGCVQVGDVVTVGFGANGTSGTFNATTISGNPGFSSTTALEATVVQTTPTPEAVITSVPSGNTDTLTVGQVVTLTFTPGAVFSNSSGVTLPGQFASPTDLVVGQNVLVDASSFTAAAPPTLAIATVDAIELLPTEINGTADNIGTAGAGDLTIDVLNSFFTGNGVTAVDAQTNSSTTFSGTVTQFSDITAGESLTFTGFLENNPATPGTPVFLTTNVFGAQATAAVVKGTKR